MANNQQNGGQKNQGQGQVKDPQNDGRLKDNRGGQQGQSMQDDDVQPGGQGRVKDPAHDGRLKQNQ